MGSKTNAPTMTSAKSERYLRGAATGLRLTSSRKAQELLRHLVQPLLLLSVGRRSRRPWASCWAGDRGVGSSSIGLIGPDNEGELRSCRREGDVLLVHSQPTRSWICTSRSRSSGLKEGESAREERTSSKQAQRPDARWLRMLIASSIDVNRCPRAPRCFLARRGRWPRPCETPKQPPPGPTRPYLCPCPPRPQSPDP